MPMGRLAVHLDYRGCGRSLIMAAALRTDRLGVGAFALLVDAKDHNACAFYEAHEFMLLIGETRRLFLPCRMAIPAQSLPAQCRRA
jgi:GNAT superfamily N-acetyltransferase